MSGPVALGVFILLTGLLTAWSLASLIRGDAVDIGEWVGTFTRGIHRAHPLLRAGAGDFLPLKSLGTRGGGGSWNALFFFPSGPIWAGTVPPKISSRPQVHSPQGPPHRPSEYHRAQP